MCPIRPARHRWPWCCPTPSASEAPTARSSSARSDRLVCRRLPGEADLFTLHAARPETYPFLLESGALQGGRYSLLLGDCGEERQLLPGEDARRFFAELSAEAPGEPLPDLPFQGGWLLYLAYDLVSQLQPHLDSLPLVSGRPLARAVHCGAALIVDHRRRETLIVAAAERQAAHLPAAAGKLPTLAEIDWRWSEEAPDRYRRAVARAVEYIHAGDVYQVNLSRRWHGPAMPQSGMLAAYARLRQHNPAPFAASAHFAGLSLASASPERLFSVADGVIETRPIAGTRPRGRNPAEDQRLRAELAANLKERAEHIMLVDLERHDLGRISRPGTVQVDELEVLESYASVHHLVSNLRGQLRSGLSLAELFEAIFPGGTITGCPKLRCMQIIAELEGRPRGAYTGSLGYLSDAGRMDFNILIRSLVWEEGACHFDAGAGIVADSRVEAELEETRAKAAGLIRALIA